MGDPLKDIPTQMINPDLHIIETTKEGAMRYAITFASMNEASYYREWILRIPEIEARLTALENRFNSCPNCTT